MRNIGSDAALAAVVIALSLSGDLSSQPANTPVDTNLYPASVKFCSEHVTGAPQKDGTSGMHISWTGYYSTDPPDRVVAHYTKLLGSGNHRREGDQDIWRFPVDKPERVVTVTHAQGTFPRGQCSPPPESARTIVIISIASRPGSKP